MEITFNEVNYNDFHDLSFKINNDKIVGITGSGKSILLKIIACNIHIKGKILYTHGIFGCKMRDASKIHQKAI